MRFIVGRVKIQWPECGSTISNLSKYESRSIVEARTNYIAVTRSVHFIYTQYKIISSFLCFFLFFLSWRTKKNNRKLLFNVEIKYLIKWMLEMIIKIIKWLRIWIDINSGVCAYLMTTYLMIVHQDCIYIVLQTNNLKYTKISFDIVESPILRYKNYDDYTLERHFWSFFMCKISLKLTITKNIERLESSSTIV